MILEGLVTTLNANGSVNISPMGPQIDNEMRSFVLKPYTSSRTYQNLKRCGEGVFHVTDDVLLLAQAAIGQPTPLPALLQPTTIACPYLSDACRWYAFRVRKLDDTEERTRIDVEVVESGRVRDFVGFNRARSAVLEAAILATRVHLLPAEEIFAQFESLQVLVEKTGDEREHEAFQLLADHVRKSLAPKVSKQALDS